MMVQAPPRRAISRWELALYAVVLTYNMAGWAWSAYEVSREFDHGHSQSGAFKTYKGWIPGVRNDLSDIQWRQYREGLPGIIIALSIYTIASQALQNYPLDAAACHYTSVHNAVRLAAAVVFLLVLHGAFTIHVLSALCLHYVIARSTAGLRVWCPLAVWALPSAVWLAARLHDGVPFHKISPALAPLDRYGGLVRWQIGFNLLALRMISWGLDYHWAALYHRGVQTTKGAVGAANRDMAGMPLKERQRSHHSEEWYRLPVYLVYCLYPPLYLTGPTITFNDFVCQLHQPRQPSMVDLGKFAARVVVTFLTTELLTHSMYCNAITRFQPWARMPTGAARALFPARVMFAVAFYKLVFIWLKFTVIWRVSRLFSLADGVDPPENMLRCVCNNYDITGFWRNWHASFNKWIVRYMYIPMGGSKWRLLNVWIIFTFVAIWHDLEWHLLRWAWLMAVFIAPEMICKAIINTPKWKAHWYKAWFLHLCAVFAAAYIGVMIGVNLVGYGMGQDGVNDMLWQLAQAWPSSLQLLLTFFCAAHLMFEIRRKEKERLL